MTIEVVVAAVVAYALGMFPTAILVGKRIDHHPTDEGSGNPGATNIYRIGGRTAGIVVAIVDASKGAVPTLVALLLWDRPEALAAWLGAVVGHVWPVVRHLRGGKGVATSGGGAIVLDPMVGLVCGVVFIVVARVSRVAALGSLSVAVVYPALGMVTGWTSGETMVALIVMGLLILRHRSNITRLWRGTEMKV